MKLFGVVVLGCASIGCLPGLDGPSPNAPVAREIHHCPVEYTIDDGEDGNHQLAMQKGRNGYWYTFADELGTTIMPRAGKQGGTFGMTMTGGANGSLGAARAFGKITDKGGTTYGGLGFSFVDPKGPYDASKYTGFSFYARTDGPILNVRLKVPDINTETDGKVCTECFNDFGADIEVGPTWIRYEVAFDVLRQQDGWGMPRPDAVDRTKLFGIQWQVNGAGAFDLYVDDVQFMGCP